VSQENQKRLFDFLRQSELAAAEFTAAQAATAAGLKPASIATYISKKLAPTYVSKQPTSGAYRAHGLAALNAADFVALMTQKTLDTLPLFEYAALQTAQPPRTGVQPTYFTRLTLKGIGVDELVSQYLDWIEGTGLFANSAEQQRVKGVPAGLDRGALLRGLSPECGPQCEIAVCKGTEEILIKFVHAYPQSPTIKWWTMVRLQGLADGQGGVRVEHATGREAPERMAGPNTTGMPRVLRALLERNGISVEERDAGQLTPRLVGVDAAGVYAAHDLTDEHRVLPHLVVAAEQYGSRPGQRARRLAQLLGTQVVVVALELGAILEFNRTLDRLGFPEASLGLDAGSVRLYQPDLRTNRRPAAHPIWDREQLKAIQPEQDRKPDDQFAYQVADKVVWRALPPRFFALVDDFSRQRRSSATDQLLHASLAQAKTAQEKLANREHEIALLRAALHAAESETKYLAAERDAYVDELAATRIEKEELEQLLGIAESEREVALREKHKLGARLDGLTITSPSGLNLDDANRSRIVALLQGEDLPSALELVERLFPDRLIVLASARASAAAAAEFKYSEKALALLLKLATDYWTQVQTGGDAAAKTCFGANSYAAVESETVMNRKKPTDLRTFTYNGAPVVMWRHLKIGNKDSATETWRCHFHVDSANAKVVIGHCGRHLDHA
jgi:hypothetical protein